MSRQGVCFFICGNWRSYLGLAAVAIHSLRKHCEEPIAIMLGEDVTDELPLKISDVEIVMIPLADVRRHKAYVSKSSIWRFAPFDKCALLDADTITVGDISELFEAPLTVTRFAKWLTTGRIVGGRIAQWEKRGIHAETAQRIRREPQPAINTGVTSWDRTQATPILEAWEALSREGFACSFTDELAAQILLAEQPDAFRLVDDRWNCSASFGQASSDDVRILHYHGRRMIPGRGKPDCAASYRPHLLEALEENTGGIRDWLESVDPALWDLAKRSPALAT